MDKAAGVYVTSRDLKSRQTSRDIGPACGGYRTLR